MKIDYEDTKQRQEIILNNIIGAISKSELPEDIELRGLIIYEIIINMIAILDIHLELDEYLMKNITGDDFNVLLLNAIKLHRSFEDIGTMQ
jgi:hypothetical protein